MNCQKEPFSARLTSYSLFAVTVLRFLVVNLKTVKHEASVHDGAESWFSKVPQSVLAEILKYVDYEQLLDGLLMTNTGMLDLVRGVVPLKRVTANSSVDSQRIQALASPGDVVEFYESGLHMSGLNNWQRLVTGRGLKKLVVEHVAGLKGVNVRSNLPYFGYNYPGASRWNETLPFFESVKTVSLSCRDFMKSHRHTKNINISGFSNVTSLELVPAPEKKTWNQLSDEFLAQIKNLSIEVMGFSYVPFSKLKNVVALRWWPAGRRSPPTKEARLYDNMEHLKQLKSLFISDRNCRTSSIWKAVKRHGVSLKHVEFRARSAVYEHEIQILRNAEYFGVTFSDRVSMSKSIVDMVGCVKSFQLLANNTEFCRGGVRKLEGAAQAVGGKIKFSKTGGIEKIEFLREPQFTRTYFVGDFPFLPR